MTAAIHSFTLRIETLRRKHQTRATRAQLRRLLREKLILKSIQKGLYLCTKEIYP